MSICIISDHIIMLRPKSEGGLHPPTPRIRPCFIGFLSTQNRKVFHFVVSGDFHTDLPSR